MNSDGGHRRKGKQDMPRYKKLQQMYHKRCTGCKRDVVINVEMKKATWTLPGIGKHVTLVSIRSKRGKRGDRWGLIASVLWVCPNCSKAHNDTFFTPDDQMTLPF